MQTVLTRALCQMSIFMICTQTLVHFRPNDSYEKYLKLLVSVMLLAQIFQPFCQIFSLGTGEALTDRVRFYQEALEKQMEQALEHTSIELTLEELGRQELERRLQEQQEGTDTAQIQQDNGSVSGERLTEEKQQSRTEKTGQQSGVSVMVDPIEEITVKSDGGTQEE